MAEVWHMSLESEGRHTLFRTESELRGAVRALAGLAGAEALLFCLVDDHIHLVLACDRKRAALLARGINLALRRFAAVPFARRGAYVGRVDNRAHLTRLVSYLVEQPAHHSLPCHPALWTGSCFLDLLGARSIGALGQPLTSLLPRFALAGLSDSVGLPLREIRPADEAALRAAGAARLASAVGAALAAPLALSGNSKVVAEARAAASRLAAAAGIGTGETAAAMGVTMRCVQRLALCTSVSPGVLVAARLRLSLENAVAAARWMPASPPPASTFRPR
jgi:hypothetical protein